MISFLREAGDEVLDDDLDRGTREARSMVERATGQGMRDKSQVREKDG